MAQVRGLGSRVGGRLVLFCIHRVNRVYGALVVTSWTVINCRIIIIIKHLRLRRTSEKFSKIDGLRRELRTDRKDC